MTLVGITKVSIDDRLNKIIEKHKSSGYRLRPIGSWRWHGLPGPLSPKTTIRKDIALEIFNEISGATLEECLRSKSEYVRKARLFVVEKANPEISPVLIKGHLDISGALHLKKIKIEAQ